jgi:hypothetical protein
MSMEEALYKQHLKSIRNSGAVWGVLLVRHDRLVTDAKNMVVSPAQWCTCKRDTLACRRNSLRFERDTVIELDFDQRGTNKDMMMYCDS